MKNILYCSFAIILSFSAYSQKSIKLTWGQFYQGIENNKQEYFLGYSHKDSTHLLFVNNNLDLVEYNYNLEQVQVTSLKKALRYNNISGIYKIKKDAYILSVSSKGEHYIQKYDTAHNTLKDEKLIFTSLVGKPLQLKYSPDSSKVLFYTMIQDKGINKMEFVVLNESLKYKWQKVITVNSPIEHFHDPVISNAGDVYYSDTDGKYLLINGITKGGDDVFLKTIAYKSTKVLDPVLLVNKEILFVVQGFKKENVQFDCVTDISVFQYDNNGNKLAEYNYPFSECLNDLKITHLHVLSNGDILIISELLSTVGTSNTHQVQYGSLHVMRFNLASNSVVWNEEIFKNHYNIVPSDKYADQHTDEYKTFHDHKMYEYKNELVFLYNDNCSNCMTLSNGVKPKSHSAITNSCLNMVTINENGKVVRNTYSGKLNVKFYVAMNNVFRVSYNRVIVFAYNQMYRVGRLHLD